MDQDKKRIVKIVLIVILIIGVNILFTFLINSLFFKHTEGLVYRTRTGGCYHSPGCGYLHSSAIAMGIEQARKSSLSACSRCGGIPNGTIIVNNYFGSWAIFASIVFVIGLLILFVKYKKGTTQLQPELEIDNTTQVIPLNSIKNEVNTKPQTASKPQIVIKVGDCVTHTKFGKGIIKSFDGRYMKVAFTGLPEKAFVYPDAFEQGFLIKE